MNQVINLIKLSFNTSDVKKADGMPVHVFIYLTVIFQNGYKKKYNIHRNPTGNSVGHITFSSFPKSIWKRPTRLTKYYKTVNDFEKALSRIEGIVNNPRVKSMYVDIY